MYGPHICVTSQLHGDPPTPWTCSNLFTWDLPHVVNRQTWVKSLPVHKRRMRMVMVHCVCVCVCVCVCENHGGRWFDVAKSEITLNYTVMYSLKCAYAESPMSEFMYLVIYLLKYLHKAWHEPPYIVNAVKKGATIQSSKIKWNYINFPEAGYWTLGN